jgi:starvation-inducible DNA-binding protein
MSRTVNKELVESLQRAVANSLVMYLNYKRYHWNTYGPLFRDIHLLFDDHASAVLKTVDEFGERVRILGFEPIGSADEVVKLATVSNAKPKMSVKAMIEQAVANHRIIMDEFKEAMKQAEERNDPGTADVFVRNIQVHEKQEWFLREFLQKGDGLIT